MTTLTYPLNIKVRANEPVSSVPADRVLGASPFYLVRKVSVGDIGGGAIGATTIPLFVAPAGSRPINCFLDITTAANPGVGTTRTAIAVGTSASTGILYAATTVNTAGRRTYAGTEAQVSANGIVFAADTTIQAVVSVDTSAITALEVIVYAELI